MKMYPGATPSAGCVTCSCGGFAPAIVCSSPGATLAAVAAVVVVAASFESLPQPASNAPSARSSKREEGLTGPWTLLGRLSDRRCNRLLGGCQRRHERMFECVEREGLHEVRDRLECEHVVLGGIDAREEHGHVRRAQRAREAQATLVARLDHRSVERRQIGGVGILVVRDRL